jgi:spore coat polysaccharide biosynthesis protein SpsF
MKTLSLKKIESILFHRLSHVELYEGAALNVLRSFKNDDIINSIGVSIQSPDELASCLKMDWIDKIQMPFNILDHRFKEFESDALLKFSHRAEVQVRSSLLQGLFLLNDVEKWPKNILQEKIKVEMFVDSLCKKFGRDIKTIAISYVLSQPWIDNITLGVTTQQQLSEIQKILINLIDFSEEDIRFINGIRPRFSDTLLNPALWEN